MLIYIHTEPPVISGASDQLLFPDIIVSLVEEETRESRGQRRGGENIFSRPC